MPVFCHVDVTKVFILQQVVSCWTSSFFFLFFFLFCFAGNFIESYTGKLCILHRATTTGERKSLVPCTSTSECFVWLAGDTLYPGSRSKWKLQLNKITSSVDQLASKAMKAHCHTKSCTHHILEMNPCPPPPPPPTPKHQPQMDRSQSMSADRRILDCSISVGINELCNCSMIFPTLLSF